MPQYSVRFYYTYCTEYEVEARSVEEAEAEADNAVDFPEQEHPGVRLVEENVYVGYDETIVEEIIPEGAA